MSRNLLIFLLSELNTLRFVCKQDMCGVAYEVPLQKVGTTFQNPVCKGCGNRFYEEGTADHNPIQALAKAISKMQDPRIAKNLDVEFVVPEPAE